MPDPREEIGTRLSATIQLAFVVDRPPDGVTEWMETLQSNGVLYALLRAGERDIGRALPDPEELDTVEIQEMLDEVHVTSATCLVCPVSSPETTAETD